MMKRITALLLSLCCVFSMFPSVAGAANDDTSSTEKKDFHSQDSAFRFIDLRLDPLSRRYLFRT